MEQKTIMNILDDWDSYKNKKINDYEDWTKEHDDYLNTKFVTVNDMKEAIQFQLKHKADCVMCEKMLLQLLSQLS